MTNLFKKLILTCLAMTMLSMPALANDEAAADDQLNEFEAAAATCVGKSMAECIVAKGCKWNAKARYYHCQMKRAKVPALQMDNSCFAKNRIQCAVTKGCSWHKDARYYRCQTDHKKAVEKDVDGAGSDKVSDSEMKDHVDSAAAKAAGSGAASKAVEAAKKAH